MQVQRASIKYITIAIFACWVSGASAGPIESRAWFNGLLEQDRIALQSDLVLLGKYDALVDGSFGAGTLQAIQAYQTSQGEYPDGVLTNSDIAKLHSDGGAVYQNLGIAEVRDTRAGIDIFVPASLLTERSSSGDGTRYTSKDGHFDLETVRMGDTSQTFAQLFQSMKANAPNQTVSYAGGDASSFSVTGTVDDRSFYERFYDDAGGPVGFKLTWDQDAADRGTMLAAFLASFSFPLSTISQMKVASATEIGGSSKPSQIGVSTNPSEGTTEAPIHMDGGTFAVPVLINNAITLNFTIDSGASDVTIPADVVSTLIRAGTITDSDFTGTQTYILADGSSVPSRTFVIHSLKVGDRTLSNVAASVASGNGMLLLGQSFLRNFASWSIDNNRQMLVLNSLQSGSPTVSSLQSSNVPPLPAPAATQLQAPQQSAIEPSGRLAIYGGLDFYGNDLFKGRTLDAVACATACQRDQQCKAFTFNANPTIHTGPNCFLKGDANRLEAYSTAISGLFLSPQDGQAQTFNFDAIDPTKDLVVDRDLPGNDLSNYPYASARSLDACRMACIDNRSCDAFSFVSSIKQCWLKNAVGPSQFAKGIVSGIKRAVSIAPADVASVTR